MKSYLFYACLGILFACNPLKKTTPAPVITEEAQQSTGREVSLGYKSLSSFKKGQAQMPFDDTDEALPTNENLLILVLYESNADWKPSLSPDVKEIENSRLSRVLMAHKLKIIRLFELDEFNSGLVISLDKKTPSPIEALRELSMVDYVLMTHLKEIPKE